VLPANAQEPRVLLLSFEEALSIAAGESETVWVAAAGANRAEGNVLISRSSLFPQLTGSAAYTRTLRSQFEDISFGGGPPEDPEGEDDAAADLPFGRPNQYSLGLSLSQVVFDGGQTLARTRAARALRRAAAIDVDAAVAEVFLDVTQGYFDAQLADRLVEIAESALAQAEETLRLTQVAEEVGDQSEFELLRARVARDNQIPVVIQRRNLREESYLRLKQLLNLPLEDDLRLTTEVEDPVPRFAEVSDLSPEVRAPVRQAAENVTANEEQLAATRAQRLPAVALTSRYAPVAYPESGLPEPDDFQNDWTVTLGLSIPIFTGGRLRGEELVARSNLSEARARLQQTREAAALESRTAVNDLAGARAALESNTSTVAEAERAYSIAQLRFREGISTQLELTDARLLLEQARANRAQAQRDVQVARARLALLEDLPLGQGASAALPLQQTQPVRQAPATTTIPSPASGAVPGVPNP
jgi:outer membrane protein TolC